MTEKPNAPRRAAPPPDQSAYARGLAKFRRDFGGPERREREQSTWDDPYDDCC
jgi:hypothetical protein